MRRLSRYSKGDRYVEGCKEIRKRRDARIGRPPAVHQAGRHVAAAVGTLSWPRAPLFAAQPARKRIVIHGERQVTSLGYHNRRETEHVSMVDAGLVGKIP